METWASQQLHHLQLSSSTSPLINVSVSRCRFPLRTVTRVVGVVQYVENSSYMLTTRRVDYLTESWLFSFLALWAPQAECRLVPDVSTADIPKTQQLTSQQYKWINNTTGEGFVFLFWAWTVRFTSSFAWKHQESSIRFYVTKSRFMITVHVNNIHCLISVTLMIIYLWGHCTLISAVQVEFVIIMIRSDRLDEFTLL